MPTAEPILKPYQIRWIADPSPRKVAVKSRRIGYTFVTSFEEVARALGVEFNAEGAVKRCEPKRGVDQYVISASMRQSIAHLSQCATHVERLNYALGYELAKREDICRTQIRFTNGKSITALPPNPRTIRGDGGDITLDEAGVIPNSMEVLRAAQPIARAHVGRPEGYRIRVVGTPCGDDSDNLLYCLMQTPMGEGWSKSRVSIYDAVKEGFPVDVEEVRRDCIGEDEFRQEYGCEFLSSISRYIPAELWDSAINHDITEAGANPSYAGYDVARKPSGDLAALVELTHIDGTLHHLSTWADRGVDWDTQERIIEEVLERRDAVAIDATGIGMQFGERLVNRYGGRVMAVEFTNKIKEELITGLKLALERGKLKVQPDSELRRDVLALRREQTKFGNVRYDAKRTGAGHADRAWALALAVHAAGGVGVVDYDPAREYYEPVITGGLGKSMEAL